MSEEQEEVDGVVNHLSPTRLEKIQMEIELEEIKEQKIDAVKRQSYEEAADLRDKERKLMDRFNPPKTKGNPPKTKGNTITINGVNTLELMNNNNLNTIYGKKNVMLDEQIEAFDEEGEPLDNFTYGVKHLTWDYKGHKAVNGHGFSQLDWNQTLMTRINEVSATIHKQTLRGGATHVYMNPIMEPIMDSLEYTHRNEDGIMHLAHRYQLVFDADIPEGTITAKHIEKNPLGNGDFVLIPEVTKEAEGNMMAELTMKLHKRGDAESDAIIEEYENRCFGTIEIINYTREDYRIELEQQQVRADKEARATDVVDVIRDIQYDRMAKNLDESGLMHNNYQNETEVQGQTLDNLKSDEEVLSEYQAACDLPMGLIFYYEKASVNASTNFAGNLVAKSMPVELQNTEKTLEQMREVSSRPTFFKWAGGNTPVKNSYGEQLNKSRLTEAIKKAMKGDDTDYKNLLGMG